MIRSDHHIFIGMQKDTSISKQSPQYLFDAKNIRLTARGGRTSLSITNEKGPKELSLVYKVYDGSKWKEQIIGYDHDEQTETEIPIYPEIEGTYMGHCTINNYLILFTYINISTDAIYRIDLETKEENSYVATRLYKGNLNFKLDHPLETLASYENESIQKVYWTDNENQPRLINIAPYKDTSLQKYLTTPTPFDFSPELTLSETISVSKKYSGGSFAAGVIQYAITYYNKYAQETAIVATTPLYYISPFGRGGSPEETCSNSFVITVSNVDTRFEYLRVYSIQRTSLNGTPICKRLQDIELGNDTSVQYIDTGTNGDIVDPSSLLFIGGEEVIAETLCQKDGTLFLGNISIKRPSITPEIKSSIGTFFYTNNPTPVNADSTSKITTASRICKHSKIVAGGDFKYASTLEEYCAGFKNREYYRLGLQFQYRTGNWSEPIWIMDYQMKGLEQLDDGVPQNTTLKTELSSAIVNSLISLGYRKVRAMIATPSLTNRTIIFQGVYNPTMYRYCDRYGADPTGNDYSDSGVGHLYGQASWIFRPASPTDMTDFKATNWGGIISGGNGGGRLRSQYDTDHSNSIIGPYAYSTEIQGYFPANSCFFVENRDTALATINSPDILWDNDVLNYSFGSSCKMSRVGYVTCNQDYADIDITTSSSTIGSLGSGFIHRAFNTDGYAGLLSQLCYQDNVVDDKNDGTSYGIDNDELKYPTTWIVYMWHRNGSLNNDVNRAGRSAMLQTKKISNYRIADTTYYGSGLDFPLEDVKLFNSEELQYLKVGGKPYLGNVDTMLAPENSGFYFSNYPNDTKWETNGTYQARPCARLVSGKRNGTTDVGLLQYFDTGVGDWRPNSGGGTWTKIGDTVFGLGASREGVRMKYKSTPHAVVYGGHVYPGNGENDNYYPVGTLPIVEIYEPYDLATLYGGTSEDALKAISWIPAGPAVTLDANTYIEWLWGDTFFNRWDCLKTYAFSREDQNQVVDILSFPVESHINLDGRYDKNRGQPSNLNMSPTNYNLMNMVYSQLNNFFSYRIMDSDYYNLDSFHNQVTWTSEKVAGSNVDPWTQVTLASTHDLDGSKGQVRALKTWKNNIYCFQDTGIANIIFNPRVQIPTSDGIPIEIGNSYKVEGKRYLSETLGCINKSTICESPSSLYFIDNISKDLYAISPNGLTAISDTCNMRTWFSGLPKDKWTPEDYTIKVFYDSTYKDLYITTEDTCLCFSETLGQFVSFMSYEGTPAMMNIGSSFYALRNGGAATLWEMFKGYYSMFFGIYKPFSLTFISNTDSALDKTFLNLEIQADFYDNRTDATGEPFYHKINTLNNKNLNPKRFFNSVRVETEYQDSGVVSLNWKNFRSFGSSPYFKTANAAKKNRVWRIELPRDRSNNTKVYDRIRNTWAKITLENNAVDPVFMELHNISVEYFV